MPPTPKLKPEDLEKGLSAKGKWEERRMKFGGKKMKFGENPRSGYR